MRCEEGSTSIDGNALLLSPLLELLARLAVCARACDDGKISAKQNKELE